MYIHQGALWKRPWRAGLLKEAVHLRCLTVELGDGEREQIIQLIYIGQPLKTKWCQNIFKYLKKEKSAGQNINQSENINLRTSWIVMPNKLNHPPNEEHKVMLLFFFKWLISVCIYGLQTVGQSLWPRWPRAASLLLQFSLAEASVTPDVVLRLVVLPGEIASRTLAGDFHHGKLFAITGEITGRLTRTGVGTVLLILRCKERKKEKEL